MDTIPIRVQLQKLFCFHGDDESDSEPYLWTIAVTIDGRTITHVPGSPTLTGGPDYVFSPSSHGSIGGSMGIGTTRRIPDAVGHLATTLQPIVLSAGGRSVEVPGHVGLIAVLLEEDSTSDDGAEAAPQAINTLVRTELDEAVAQINMVGLAAEVQAAVAGGAPVEDAARGIFMKRVELVVARIRRVAQSVAVTAIVEKLSFPAAIVEAADPDNFQGIVTLFWSQDQLAATTHTHRLDIHERIAQPGVHPEASEFVYNLHGQAWQPIEEVWVPVTDQVPPGRWQVTGISKAGRPPKTFISAVGGTFAGGAPWLLPKGRVMDAIAAGTHSFFVRGSSGVESTVLVDPNEANRFFPFLTTTPDDDPSNNLAGLPPAPLAIRHTTPAPG